MVPPGTPTCSRSQYKTRGTDLAQPNRAGFNRAGLNRHALPGRTPTVSSQGQIRRPGERVHRADTTYRSMPGATAAGSPVEKAM